jgi:hypothetical protein
MVSIIRVMVLPGRIDVEVVETPPGLYPPWLRAFSLESDVEWEEELQHN